MSTLIRRNLKSAGILLIGIFAGLAISTAIPAAQAAPTSHNDIITAINNAVTSLQNAIMGVQSEVETTVIQTDRVVIDVHDHYGTFQISDPSPPGKIFKYHVELFVGGQQTGTSDTVGLSCGSIDNALGANEFGLLYMKDDFICTDGLSAFIIDNDDDGQDGFVQGVTYYVEDDIDITQN